MTLPAQTHRLSSCHRHPSKPITGFCAACLSERLAGIDSATHQETPADASKLRRSKSCSGSKFVGFAGILEPRRNSCDVRAQNTLWDLLHVARSGPGKKLELEIGNLGYELKEEDEAEEEIRVSEVLSVAEADVIGQRVLRDEEFDEGIEMKTMKEHIDLEWKNKKNAGKDFNDFARSFREVTSVFSKKFRKWRGKQKLKKESDLVAVEVGKPTQSEVGNHGIGRRSCDTDPRMSLDAVHHRLGIGRRSCDNDPRMSLDASDYVRFSFDEPRVSWDGYATGRLAPLVSVVEDDDEVLKVVNEEQKSPGGSAQTRDYYTLQRRRRSFDRKAAGLEVEELKSVCNAKVTPETSGLFHGAKLLVTEKELESNCNQRNGGSHSSESSRSTCNDIAGQTEVRGWHKVWHVWGSIQKQKQGVNKCDYLVENAESLQKLRRVANGEGKGTVSEKLIRSYSVSSRSRNPYGNMAGLVHNMSGIGNVSKGREEAVLQQNQTNLDDGLLQLHLTPLRSSRGKSGKSRSRNVL